MTTREWKPGDRALLPVEVLVLGDGDGAIVVKSFGRTEHIVLARDLIPDTRPPSWLPGQPGDVAEWGGQRWFRLSRWYASDPAVESVHDSHVPADAVLVLPAKTREA